MNRGVIFFGVLLLLQTVILFNPAAGMSSETSGVAGDDVIRLYLDADFTSAASSSTAIEQGMRTALSEVDNTLGGYRVEIIRKDHRGNSRRSLDNMKDYLADDKALAVFTGLHSPPLLANREFINKNGVLTLDPWAAAGPITRYPSKKNWIFRLSVDDSKAGFVIVRHAIKKLGLKRPALLLEQTGWGKSNEKTMGMALAELGVQPAGVFWFNWGVNESAARIILRAVIDSGADGILLVANSPEGKIFVKSLVSLPEKNHLPICSHWGITGGDFPEVIGPEIRRKIKINFLQTSFSFISNPADSFGQKVLQRARQLFPDKIKSARDIRAPAGFIHAYDLTLLLIAAVEKTGLSKDIRSARQAVRSALENIESPVRGLIKTYSKPFTVFDEQNPDAHEALTIKDLVMARYGDQNEIILAD